MVAFLTRLFDPSGFPARWQCGSGWAQTPWLGWLHILSDLGVWSAYVAIPFVLIYFLLRRKDLPFRKIFLLFGAFILACGTTHLMEAIIFWWPVYRLAGVIKLFTAIISWATVFSLFQVVPVALTMRSPQELEREIAGRRVAEEQLHRANTQLETRVQQRTNELTLAVDALHEERELLRTTLGSIGDGVIATDNQGRVTFLNQVAEILTGWASHEAKGLPLNRVFQIIDNATGQPIVYPVMNASHLGLDDWSAHDILLRAKDGSERPIDQSAAPIQGEVGVTRGAILVFRDISHFKSAELALKESDRRKDEFLAMLAHELRNPLAPIRSSLEIMKRSPGNGDIIEQCRTTMERQSGQLVRLVDDLIDVSRITRNRLELRIERAELAPIIRHAVESCKPAIEQLGHHLNIQLPVEPIYLQADAARLAQVFSNLLTNSCKYTEQGGQIGLSAQTHNGNVIVRVSDNGIGIPPSMLSQVFDMFVQIDQSLERTKGGLGIGLTLVKRIVEMHGGTVVAHSEGSGKGSEFTVQLPLLDDAPSNAAVQTTSEPLAGSAVKQRILVVDDNVDGALSLAMMLRILGNETRTADDGLAAIKAAAEFVPDVILLDIGLPKMNGYDVCRRIREQAWSKNTLIVALTGWGQDKDREQSAEAGFDHHLVKPVDLAALQKLLAARQPR